MAAGKGTRLKSKHPKVLHEVGGKPILTHVIATAARVVPPKDIFVIIGHEADLVRQRVESTGIRFVVQEPQRGTGHALMCAEPALTGYDQVIVLSGDAPLITADTIRRLRDFHQQKKAAMTLLSAELANSTGYGRVIRARAKSAVHNARVVPHLPIYGAARPIRLLKVPYSVDYRSRAGQNIDRSLPVSMLR